ncbi:NUDIX hydrolase [Ruminococcus albus]|uniref:Isopentenyldiphosphate isomerase n=1 Tax=Ruminococcus albus TaxID=1264 RepID=A0A1I1Q5J2_RUMAL|nr:NUDIX domain-containing protein [Ruminococcus albus]SFD17295.1 Isopentenyldiphosphate isomerase [Ruminococcus albus]
MAEILDIVDENGIPTGETIDRETAHLKGILHRTSHVWILREKDGRVQVLLQKRADDKSSFPGCYDISSAGHIPAGVDFIPSALRELEEELSVTATAEQLHYCGIRHIRSDDEFFGKEFHDRQVSKVFALWLDTDESGFELQIEEVDSVLWIDFDECVRRVRENTFKHCIVMEELMMLKDHIDRRSTEI